MNYRLYYILTYLLLPLFWLIIRLRLLKGKEDPTRINERFGQPKKPRPDTKLIWIHAASVGESISLLTLIKEILVKNPDNLNIMITTGTITSAKIMQERLPKGAFHQFIPVDHPKFVKAFLEYWKPDLAIYSESEFWPNLIHLYNKEMILINARISDKSFISWQKHPKFIKSLLDNFSIILAQNEQGQKRFEVLGSNSVKISGNLKYASDPLPINEQDFDKLNKDVKDKNIWVFASSHSGEEEQIIKIHNELKEKIDNLVTIIIPRHPNRGEEIAKLCQDAELNCSLRSVDKRLNNNAEIYIADTIGETGLFFKLSNITVIGGSFIEHGGHNPIEPAWFNSKIICGPYMFNFSSILDDFEEEYAIKKLEDSNELSELLIRIFEKEKDFDYLANNAIKLVQGKAKDINKIMKDIKPYLDETMGN